MALKTTVLLAATGLMIGSETAKPGACRKIKAGELTGACDFVRVIGNPPTRA